MTSRIAFIFPGRGAQYCGMGKDFYKQAETGRKVFDRASELLGFSVPELYFTKNDRLGITKRTQAAMVTTSIAMMDVLRERGVKPDVTAELSLGEYYTLVTVSVMSEDDIITTVKQRGTLVQEAVPTGVDTIAAILALGTTKVEEVLGGIEGVQIANYNCPGQTVISGEIKAMEETNEALLVEGAKRTIMLNVSGPFHFDMLQRAGRKPKAVLEGVEIHQPTIPYVTDVTASCMTSADEVKPLLEEQVPSSARWQQSVETMVADGVNTSIEIGPGRTLAGFTRKISRDVKVLNIEKLEDAEKVVERLK